MNNLDKLRKKTEKIDSAITDLLKKRLFLVKKIGILKSEESIPIKQIKREKNLIEKLNQACGNNNKCKKYLIPIFRKIYKQSRLIQKKIGKNRNKI